MTGMPSCTRALREAVGVVVDRGRRADEQAVEFRQFRQLALRVSNSTSTDWRSANCWKYRIVSIEEGGSSSCGSWSTASEYLATARARGLRQSRSVWRCSAARKNAASSGPSLASGRARSRSIFQRLPGVIVTSIAGQRYQSNSSRPNASNRASCVRPKQNSRSKVRRLVGAGARARRRSTLPAGRAARVRRACARAVRASSRQSG